MPNNFSKNSLEMNTISEQPNPETINSDNPDQNDPDTLSDVGRFIKGALLITASVAAIVATIAFAGVPAIIAGATAAILTSVTIDQFRNDLEKPVLDSLFEFSTLASAAPMLFLPHNPILALTLGLGTTSLIQASDEYLEDHPLSSWWILAVGCLAAILLIKI